MGFVLEWCWYLLAFVAGSAVAWAATVLLIEPRGEDERS